MYNMQHLRDIMRTLSETERTVMRYAAIIFCIATIAFGVIFIDEKTAVMPTAGGTFVEGMVGQPTLVNPVLPGGTSVDRDLNELLFADLLTLAEATKYSDDGRVWNIVLKKNARWSDGEPLGADDVLFTIETIQDTRTGSPLFQTWQGVVIERVSEHEVKLTLKTPYAYLKDNLRELRIIPKHIFGIIPSANLRLSQYNLEPIGSGSFAFSKYEKRRDGFITDVYLTTNPYANDTKPYIENVQIKFFLDGAELIRAFNKLEVDGIGGQDEEHIKNITVGSSEQEIPLPRYYAVFFNQSLQPALKDANVRRALELAADRERMVIEIFNSHATSTFGPLMNGIEGYASDLYTNNVFALANAENLLEDNGWKRGSDGIREKQTGKQKARLEFEITVPQIPFLTSTAGILKENWAKIGIKLVVIPVPPDEITDGAIKTRNYQMLLFGNILKQNPDVFAFWHSSERFSPGLNLAVYDNKKIDALLESIRKNLNSDAREKNLRKLQEIIQNDAPAIFLFSPNYRYVFAKRVQGFSVDHATTPADRFQHIAQWYLKTKRVLK